MGAMRAGAKKVWVGGCIAVVMISSNSAGASLAVSVDEWRLTTRIADISNLPPISNTITNLSNPLGASDLVKYQNSTANSDYSAAWDTGGFFSFTVFGQHAAQGDDDLYSRSSGTIRITPSIVSLLVITGEYDYTLASGIRGASISGTTSFPNGSPLYTYQESKISIFDPPSGVMSFASGEIPLSAGVQYTLGYMLKLDSFSGSPTSLSHGNGFVSFELTPAPEPATMGYLASLCTIIVLRSGSRQCMRDRR